jgi:hypothetical protein
MFYFVFHCRQTCINFRRLHSKAISVCCVVGVYVVVDHRVLPRHGYQAGSTGILPLNGDDETNVDVQSTATARISGRQHRDIAFEWRRRN